MTDNQFREMMDKLTELEDEIQKMIEEQVQPKVGTASLNTVLAELKAGQENL